MVKQGGERVLWCWLIVVNFQYLPCFCLIPYTGTMAAQWTLYSGLKLSWNEASKFCNSLGGHLPVLNTKIRYNGFNETAVKWRNATLSLNDIWTGLYTPARNEKPNRWEWDCSLQPDGLSFWGDGEPNELDTHFCVRYKQENQKLCTWDCNTPYDIVCEFDKGSCRNSIRRGSLQTNLQTEVLNNLTVGSCWEQCMKLPPTSSGQECVGAVLSLGTCTRYMKDTLLSNPSITEDSVASTMLKECFDVNVNNRTRLNTSIITNSSIPQPAVDLCGASKTSSFTGDPMSTRDQMSTAASTQPQRSGDTITQTAREQSSSEPQTETTWLTAKISTQDNTDVNAAEPVSTSWTTQNSKRQSTEETATTSQSSETAVDNTRNTNTERLTSSTELSQYQTPTTSGVPEYSSSSEVNPSTTGPKPVLCPCIKSYPNVSTMLPVMPRNTTARYRRSHNSEWGSPSVYTSTSSAIFVIAVGLAGFLFVVCDINRSLSLCGKNPHKRSNQPSMN